MRPQLRHFILFVMFLPPLLAFGQQTQSHITSTNCPGVPGACGYPANSNPAARSGPNVSPQNGNGTLGVIYDQQKCGLDFTSASQRLGKRFTPQGINQPAPFAISGIPACAVIEKAYLWAEGSGNGAAQTATINGPLGTASYPMSVVGQGPDKCWGYSGTYTYRADVTASVNGNGTYNISGLLTNPPTAGNDMDGATLLVIWSVPSATFAGRLIIADGAYVVNGGTANYNMPISPAVCGATTGAKAFLCVGDIQFNPTSWTLNGTPGPLSWNWWNYVQVNTTVNAAATTSNFNINTGGDCFNLSVTGLYFRTTTCTTCPTTTALTITSTTTPATCSNCNGSANVTVTPAGSYTYSWSPAPGAGGNTATPSQMCAGNYVVTVTSACTTVTATVNIATQGGSITLNSTQTNVDCNGSCNGSATVTATGGTAPYAFTWTPTTTNSTVGNVNTATSLCAGTYVVNCSDASSCTGTTTITITQPPPVTFTQSQTPASCFGSCDGSATVVAAGGNGTYSYNWSPTPGGGQGTPTATGLCAGTYNCTISSGPSTCTTVATFNITEPTAISIVQLQTDVTCFGSCDGTANVVASGGTGTYSYNWVPAPGAGQGTANATGLCPGTYVCTVTDANLCSTASTFVITEPPQLTTTGTQTDVTCFAACNGTANVTTTGGTGAYSYNWSPAPGGGQGTPNATGLCAGTYVCTVSDANNCTTTISFTITEPTQLTLAAAGFNVSCFGGCDGQIVVIPSGGTPPYSFSWSTGCTNASCSNICAGSYNVTVTDLNGCTATASVTVTEPPDITIATTTIDANCNQADGSASATFSGGTGTLTPVWYNPQQAAGATYSNIPAGNYFVVVTDQNGCDDTASVVINNLPGVTASAGPQTNVSCFGGSNGALTVLDNNVNAPYTYSWTCSSSTTSSATGLSAGNCTVTLTDAVGCTSSVSFTVTEPPLLSVTASATPGVVCAGQSIQMSGTTAGGTPAFQYAWNPGQIPGLTQTITPSASGTYTLYVVDANGCTDSSTVSFTVESTPVPALSGDQLSGCAPICVNFSDLSTIASGTIVGWNWDFGDGNTSTSQNPSNCFMLPGLYDVTLTVTSVAGCSNTIVLPNYIDVFANPVADFTANPQPTTELNPTIYFTDQSTGGITTWSWSFGDLNNASSAQQNPAFTYPGPGCYDVLLTVTTSNGCEDTTMHPICIDADVAFYVPNAFTPNGDGKNDVFRPEGVGIDPEHYELWIFDRWGNQIYYTKDWSEGWQGAVQGKSGEICQQDVYVWKIKCLDMNGKKHNMLGRITLVR